MPRAGAEASVVSVPVLVLVGGVGRYLELRPDVDWRAVGAPLWRNFKALAQALARRLAAAVRTLDGLEGTRVWLLLHPDLSAAAAAVAAAAKAKLVTAPGEGSRRLSAAALGARRRSSVLQLRKSSVSAVAAALSLIHI